MNARSQASTTVSPALEKGQRLYCPRCHSEIEIINPGTAPIAPPSFRCCGEDMRPTTEVAVNLDV